MHHCTPAIQRAPLPFWVTRDYALTAGLQSHVTTHMSHIIYLSDNNNVKHTKTQNATGQWSVFDHNGDKQSAVLGTRYGTWWPLYGRFEVGWLQPLQLWLSAGISLVALVLVSRNRDLCHVQLHPTWFEAAAGWRSWPVVSNLHSGHPPEDLCHGQGSPSPAGQLLHFRLCHNGLVSSRNEMCAFVIQQPEGFMIWQIKGFSVSSPSIPCKQDIESE